MPKVYNQPINKLKRIVFDVSQNTEELAVRQQDAKLLHAAFVSFVKAEKANAEELQELVKTANETEKKEKAVKADLDAIYEELATASDAGEAVKHLELEAEKIESAFEDVSDKATGVPAIYERARALSRDLESLDECMSRLCSLALENPDVTYDDFTYERILRACVTYANAQIATQDHSIRHTPYASEFSVQLDMQLDMQLVAIATALQTLETMDNPIVDPTFTDKAFNA